jgi:hypothetical protein
MRMPRLIIRFAAALAAAVVLASCGGGTSQVDPFSPARYIALGDDLSAFEGDGRKYAVNGVDTTTNAIDCELQPLWIQDLASIYGFGFPECPVGDGEQRALSRAKAGDGVAELEQQVVAQRDDGGFGDSLVTVLVGANDVRALYADYPDTPEDDLIAEARSRGERIAAQVNRIVDFGGKVIVSTVPDLGLSPFALAEKAAHTDTDRAKLISRLTAALNSRIRTHILNDGRFVGLVLADEFIQSAVRFPSSYSLTNVTEGVCEVALPDCTTLTLADDALATTSLWADGWRLSTGGHFRIGVLAESRARNNPF